MTPVQARKIAISAVEWRARYKRLLRESTESEHRAQAFAKMAFFQQEADRREISRELHDEIAQILTGINLQLAVLAREASKSEKSLRDRILSTQGLVQHSVETVHRFARELRPLILDDLGLIAALRAYTKDFTKQHKLPVKLDLKLGRIRLSDLAKTVLFRVAQEALTNVAKHAKATRVSISLRQLPGRIVLDVQDNGCAFKVKPKATPTRRRLGLLGMEERIRMAGGTLTITSSRRTGTLISASVPTGRVIGISKTG